MAYADEDVSDSGMSEEEEMDEDEDVLAPAAGQRPPAVNNRDGLASALEDFAWPKDTPWIDTLAVPVADDGSEKDAIPDVDDDVARESVFHQRALAAVVAAGAHLAAAGVPVRRPDDYYAEMVKNDAHMRKVKDKLYFEQRQLDAKAERRRERENKQYGKQVQAEKLKERKAQQKADIGLLQRMKKRGAGVSSTDILPEEPDWGAPDLGASRGRGGRGGGSPAGRGFGAGRGRSAKRREGKEAKFGFGGRKGRAKQNDANSSADMSAYRTPRASGGRGGRGGRGGSGGRGGGRR